MIIHGFLIDPSLETIDVVRVDGIDGVDSYGCFFGGIYFVDSYGDRIHFCKPKPGDVSFQVDGVLQPIFGRGLILGHDSSGGIYSVDSLICGPRIAYIEWLHHIRFDNSFMIPFKKMAGGQT